MVHLRRTTDLGCWVTKHNVLEYLCDTVLFKWKQRPKDGVICIAEPGIWGVPQTNDLVEGLDER